MPRLDDLPPPKKSIQEPDLTNEVRLMRADIKVLKKSMELVHDQLAEVKQWLQMAVNKPWADREPMREEDIPF